MNTNFHKIEIKDWARKDEFLRFEQIPCSFSLTADVNITNLDHFRKKNNLKLYPLLIALMSQVVNEHYEYRYAWQNEKFGYYDVLHPLFFALTKDHNVKMMSAEYQPNLIEQVAEIEKVRKMYQDSNAYCPQKDLPANVVNISSIPWLNFSNLSFNLPESKKYYFPIFTFGQYKQENGQILLPLAVCLNHSVNDGYHASLLYQFLQEKINLLEV